MKKIRVRYAPSPTGYLHIGNARTALFNYLYAKHYDGDFVIRIEDTDIKRNIIGGVESQLENLKWLGIEWDESVDIGGPFEPYNQLARNEERKYDKFIYQLLEEKKAYRCFCTSEELEIESEKQKHLGIIPRYSGKCGMLSEKEISIKIENNEEYSIRFKVPENKEIKWIDMVKGKIAFNTKDVSGDFNIVKRDGIPTYNFVVVLDDYLMQMTHILRGEDHISNTPKQIMIYEALNLSLPKFGHMSLIVNEDGKKLSKRDTSIIQFIEEYRKLGYIPEAMFNFISLLGWSPIGEEELFTHEKLIEIFDENRLSTSSAKFDINKLTWINNQYMKKMKDSDYLQLIKPFIKDIDLTEFNQHQINKICLIFKEQISYGAEITKLVKEFVNISTVQEDAKEFIKENNLLHIIKQFEELLTEENPENMEDVKKIIKQTQEITGNKGKMLFMPIRIGISGKMHGPEIPQIILIFGREKIIENIRLLYKQY